MSSSVEDNVVGSKDPVLQDSVVCYKLEGTCERGVNDWLDEVVSIPQVKIGKYTLYTAGD